MLQDTCFFGQFDDGNAAAFKRSKDLNCSFSTIAFNSSAAEESAGHVTETKLETNLETKLETKLKISRHSVEFLDFC